MKMMKRIVSACLALSIAAMGVPMTPDSMGILPLQPLSASAAEITTVASGECGAEGDNLTWTLDSTGLLTISGEGNMVDCATFSDSPWYSCRKKITAVVIEDGVTSIGDRSFIDCESMTTFTIPESVVE
ncbi:MAG: hypothetical protein IKK51_10290, partial [Oscillospiraceae bacterium]|nr:hypothetical protein [Oscillospiraceae bacterium]